MHMQINNFQKAFCMRGSIRSICVFCGAKTGSNPDHQAAAEAFGMAFAANNWRLVYGAGDLGIMGIVARAAQSVGAATLGVIPAHLVKREEAKRDVTQLIVTENMHERKKVMFMNSDAIVLLAGGAGSLDEFFEVLTWAQIGLHQKPILILNQDGYWTPLLVLLDHLVAESFADASLGSLFSSAKTVDDLISQLQAKLG
jgi:uncharacterized protein (TIGR00730 family)